MLLLSSCHSVDEVHSRLVNAFDDLVYSVGPDRTGSFIRQRNPFLSRWEGEVSYFIEWEMDVDSDIEATISGAFQKLSGIAQLKTNKASAASSANIIFRVEDHEETYLINGSEEASCYADPKDLFRNTGADDKKGVMQKAVVVLRGQKAESIPECIEHEILHVFGFWGHTQRIRSVMASFRDEQEVTRWDRILLETLYDPALSAGMKREDALAAAKQIILSKLSSK